MKIAILGATGMAGSAITDEAVRRGHHATAITRNPGNAGPKVDPIAIDVSDVAAVKDALQAADVAVLAVRPAPGQEHVQATLTQNVLDAVESIGIQLLVVGGAAPLWSPTLPGKRLIDDTDFIPAEWRSIAQASLDQFETCLCHPYQGWVYVSPPAIFEPGPRTGTYIRGTDTLLVGAQGSSQISAADFAIAVLDELENPGSDKHFTVTQSDN